MNLLPSTGLNQPNLPFAPGYVASAQTSGGVGAHGFSESDCRYAADGESFHSPRLIRSVVSQAGLGRFVYLQGKSGRRYVFSPISAEQASLYDNALFATIEPTNGSVNMFKGCESFSGAKHALYVHLLSDCDEDGFDAKADLCSD